MIEEIYAERNTLEKERDAYEQDLKEVREKIDEIEKESGKSFDFRGGNKDVETADEGREGQHATARLHGAHDKTADANGREHGQRTSAGTNRENGNYPDTEQGVQREQSVEVNGRFATSHIQADNDPTGNERIPRGEVNGVDSKRVGKARYVLSEIKSILDGVFNWAKGTNAYNLIESYLKKRDTIEIRKSILDDDNKDNSGKYSINFHTIELDGKTANALPHELIHDIQMMAERVGKTDMLINHVDKLVDEYGERYAKETDRIYYTRLMVMTFC